MKFIYSTLTNSQNYTNFVAGKNGSMNTPLKSIVINGGANLADKFGQRPAAVETQITDEDYEILKQNPVFMRHFERGFIQVKDGEPDIESAAKRAAEKGAAKDACAPLTAKNKPENVEVTVG